MFVLESTNLLLRFVLELLALGAVGYWGFKTGDGAAMKAVLGAGGPLALAVLWGTFVSPKATVDVPPVAWIALQAVVFGAAAAALAATLSPAAAAAFVLVVVANGALMAALGA